MAQDNVENEIKLYMPLLNSVARQLEAVGGTISAPRVLERNVRYDNAAGDFASAGTVLRLRLDSRARLTYKDGERLLGEYGSRRTEIEVEVSDFDKMDMLLGKLGFRATMIYEKYRTTYQLAGAEVTLDELPYGNFVEIEGDESAIRTVMEVLGLQKAKRMAASYTVLFKIVKQNLGLEMNDLTFANFKGIKVPESAFSAG